MADVKMGTTRKKNRSKKNRKFERNKIWCANYRARGQREKNKAKKLAKHLSRHPADNTARNAYVAAKESPKGLS